MAVGNLEDSAEQIRQRLIRTKDAEVALVQLDDVLEELAQHESVLSVHGARRRHVHRVHAEIGHPQVVQQEPAIGVRIGAHPPVALGRKLGQFRDQPSVFVKQLLSLVAFHPAFELRDMLGMRAIDEEWHLVRPEGSLDLAARRRFSVRSSPWAISGRSSASAAGRHPWWPAR